MLLQVMRCHAYLTLSAVAKLLPREKKKAAYDAALVTRYAHLPEVKRIARCGNAYSRNLHACTPAWHTLTGNALHLCLGNGTCPRPFIRRHSCGTLWKMRSGASEITSRNIQSPAQSLFRRRARNGWSKNLHDKSILALRYAILRVLLYNDGIVKNEEARARIDIHALAMDARAPPSSVG